MAHAEVHKAGGVVTVSASAPLETPFFFEADGCDLFGILTSPTAHEHGTAVVLLTGGGYVPGTNHNRMSVALARRLSRLGYHVLRFDYHGVGESTGRVSGFRLDRPFVADLQGALSALESFGLRRFVLVGSCFGARTLLAGASNLEGLRGVALLAPPVHDLVVKREKVEARSASQYVGRALTWRVAKGMLNSRRRRGYRQILALKLGAGIRKVTSRIGRGDSGAKASPRFVKPFVALVRRRVPALIVYGKEDAYYADFMSALRGRMEKALRAPDSGVQMRVLPGVIHGFRTIDAQQGVMDAVESWLARELVGGDRG
jgi:pimeloyl-ACP methyl ester carboxylesterase